VEEFSVKTRYTPALLAQPVPANLAELGWRAGLALAALNFVVLGLALASANPRAARSTSMVLALFAFIIYYNLMTLGQSWIGSGRMGLVGFMVLLHGGTLAIGLLLLAIRHNQWTPSRLWAPRSPA
jgi:lipopolysaccharide export system permease protein